MLTLNTPVESLRGVGPKIRAALKRLNLRTAGDLLLNEPFRYEDFSTILPIARLQAGTVATIAGKIELIGSRRSFRRRMVITEAALRDDTGYLKLVWFNQPYLGKILKAGDRIMVSGKADWQYGSFQMASPSYERIQAEQTHVGRIVPIYGATEGITPKFLRTLVRQVLPLANEIPDPLSPAICKAEKLPVLANAIRALHFPPSSDALASAQRRRIFDEFLAIQINGLRSRSLLHSQTAPTIRFHEQKTKRFVNRLPFRLTNGQRTAAWAILEDLGGPHPMNRLVQGDVGSGKTVVAVMAMLNAAWSGLQSAFMAPTEILAEQHYATVTALAGSGVPVALLTGSRALRSDQPSTTRLGLKKALAKGEIAIAIGTHALIESDVRFQTLGLTIVDEQHRFGVGQRQTLSTGKSARGRSVPHYLSLTATPIPRTVALALYSGLDISTVAELPKDRKLVITKLIPESERSTIYSFAKKQIATGHQAFILTALIDESDMLGIKAATQMHKHLQAEVFPDLRIGLLHGRMTAKAKETVMRKFSGRSIDVLVTTSVVEVGIDIPNATVMIVENAERFGLAQLHQFRGRVGRSDAQSYCFLLTGKTGAGPDNARLLALTKLTDGFAVAEADFKLRGPGQLRGGQQSGQADLAMASLGNLRLIERAREVAKILLAANPTLEQFPTLLQNARNPIHWE